MVLCWLTSYLGLQSSAVTFVFVFLCCLFLPQLTQHSLAVLPVSQRLSLVTRCHQPSRCSLQQVLSSPLQPPTPKHLCFISMIKLMGNVGFCILLSPLLASCCFFQEKVTRARQPLFYLPFIGTPSQTISLSFPPNFFLIGIIPYSYPSLLYSPHSFPH